MGFALLLSPSPIGCFSSGLRLSAHHKCLTESQPKGLSVEPTSSLAPTGGGKLKTIPCLNTTWIAERSE